MKTTLLQKFAPAVIVAGLFAGIFQARAQTGTTNGADNALVYLNMLRSDSNPGKIRTVNGVMKLTAPEADTFWPIYRDYEKELAVANDRKLALIREFFKHYKDNTLDNRLAKKMSEEWLNINQTRLDLWKKYSRKISKALSPLRGAQFLQVENQTALFADIDIASEMPEIGSRAKDNPGK